MDVRPFITLLQSLLSKKQTLFLLWWCNILLPFFVIIVVYVSPKQKLELIKFDMI